METDFEIDYQKGQMPNFINPKDLGARIWGEEILLCHVSGKYMLKKLILKKGCKGGLQYHRFKDESGILLSGKMIVRHENKDGQIVEKLLKEGDVFHFPPGVVHQEEAITDCIIIECGTPYLNDRVRMEKYFGLGEPEGLPTTTPEEVIKG